MDKSTLFLFIPSYVHITDLLQTGFVSDLSHRYRVVMFLPTSYQAKDYPSLASDAVLVNWTVQRPAFWGRFKILRLGLIREFDNLLSIQTHYQTGFNDWRRCFLRVISVVTPFLTARFFTRIESLFFPVVADFSYYCNKYRPRAVVVCTPGFTDLEAEAIILAKKAGLLTLAINFSWDNLTTNSKHIRHTDYLITWNEAIKAEAIKIHHYDTSHIIVSGSMRFDIYFSEHGSLQSRELNGESFNGLPLVLLTTTSHGVYPFHVDLVRLLLLFRNLKMTSPFYLLVRVHPKDDSEKYAAFSSETDFSLELAGHPRLLIRGSRNRVELTNDDLSHLRSLLKRASLAINYSSTLSLEALACNCPVVNIGFPKMLSLQHYNYEHYRPIITSGAVQFAETEKDLLRLINHNLTGQKVRPPQQLVEKFFYKTDGHAKKRCLDAVDRILKGICQ